MSEADERFAERLAEDLERYLGPEIVLEDLDLGDVEDGRAHLRATCSFDTRSQVLESDGETRLDAFSQLVIAAAELRLAVAMLHLGPNVLLGLAAARDAGSLNLERR